MSGTGKEQFDSAGASYNSTGAAGSDFEVDVVSQLLAGALARTGDRCLPVGSRINSVILQRREGPSGFDDVSIEALTTSGDSLWAYVQAKRRFSFTAESGGFADYARQIHARDVKDPDAEWRAVLIAGEVSPNGEDVEALTEAARRALSSRDASVTWRHFMRQHDGRRARPVLLRFSWREVPLWGDENVYRWSRGILGSEVLGSLYLALDEWMSKQAASGRPLAELFQLVLRPHGLVASVVPCIAAAVEQINKPGEIDAIGPIISEPRLWNYEVRRYGDDITLASPHFSHSMWPAPVQEADRAGAARRAMWDIGQARRRTLSASSTGPLGCLSAGISSVGRLNRMPRYGFRRPTLDLPRRKSNAGRMECEKCGLGVH